MDGKLKHSPIFSKLGGIAKLITFFCFVSFFLLLLFISFFLEICYSFHIRDMNWLKDITDH